MKELHCGLIGFPLVHSKSPEIHKALFSLSGRRYRYDMLEISPDKLESHVPDLEELDGFNITIPHKQSIIPYLSELDVSAGRYQAVNTVKVHRGRMVGYNTDVNGFLGALALAGIPLKGRVLICGAGGAASMAATEAVRQGCRLVVTARESSAAKGGALARRLGGDFVRDPREAGKFDLLINATPAGMFPNHMEQLPAPREVIRRCCAVFDMVYNPGKTLLIQLAEKKKLPCAKGMAMLVLQAAAAHEIWYGAQFEKKELLNVIFRMEASMEGGEGI